MLTRNHRQEALSRAYVRAIAAQAGVTVSEPENDYGIDLSLRSIGLRDGRHRDVGLQLDLQLKSTTRGSIGASHVTYDLDVVNYDDLRQPGGQTARILVLLVMPGDEALWLTQSPDELVLRHCAYWISLKGYPSSPSTSTVRVPIPLANVFSVAAVQGIIQRLREGKEP
jgi:uncharacterized protein DUF4365